MEQPTLLFEFANEKPLFFQQPIRILQADNDANVIPILREVDQAVRDGYFAAGFLSYEAAYPLMGLEISKRAKSPLIWFGIFESPSEKPKLQKRMFNVGQWEAVVSKQQYLKTVENVLHAIKIGEIDQINYTTPFIAEFSGDAFSYYEQLKHAQASKFNAFIDIEQLQILSVSPELFFQKKADVLTVRPMKGTIHRGKTYDEDNELKNWLYHSAKNRLENDMITSLMKKELTQLTTDVSIKNQYAIEKYPTVYQMTTTLEGKLADSIHVIDILKTLFPCGSISGLPKKESIEKIAEVEPYARGVYTGAIGYITPNNEAMFNVPIRTVVIDKKSNQATYFAGGAITKKSDPNEEYDEMIAKTSVLYKKIAPFQLLETILLENGEYFLLDDHLKRLQQSAYYFSYPISLKEVNERLASLSQKYETGDFRVRLTIDADGTITTEAFPLKRLTTYHVRLATSPINSNNVFLYHKTTERSEIDQHKAQLENDLHDVLLYNENDEITEFTIGNIVVEKDGKRFTPPTTCGLLAGTFRNDLLARREIEEKVITKDDLASFERIWLINSVRKWVEVTLMSN